jgi:hypothetical protein
MKLKLLAVIPLLALMFMVSGCQLACEAEKVVSGKLAGVIAMTANCSNVAAIQVDVQSAIDVVKLCVAKDKNAEHCKKLAANPKQGPIANVVCPLAATALVAVAGSQIPAAWQCQVLGSPLQSVVQTACLALPF